MSNIPTIPPTILSPEHAREFSAILKELTPESAYAFLAEAYELGRKHGRESADAENALLLEASETVHNRTTDTSVELVVVTVLSAVADKSYTLRLDPDTNEVGVIEVILRPRNHFWNDRFVVEWVQDGHAAIDSTTVVTLTRKR